MSICEWLKWCAKTSGISFSGALITCKSMGPNPGGSEVLLVPVPSVHCPVVVPSLQMLLPEVPTSLQCKSCQT